MARKKEKIQVNNWIDYSTLFIISFLLIFGLLMIYSTSSYEATATFGKSTYFLSRQLRSTLLGIVVMIVAALLPLKLYEAFAWVAYVASTLLIFAVRIPGLAYSANGATRWIKIGSITVQPAELCKIGVIMLMAALLCKIGGSRLKNLQSLMFVFLFPLIDCVLIKTVTNNLSSAIIVAGIAVCIFFVSSPEYKKFFLAGIAGIISIALIVFVVIQIATKTEAGSFRMTRVLAWLNPEAYSASTGFQTLQALYAIGSGGVFGKGLGQSMQKLGTLPEAQNDMIFSIICEELGLFGAIAVMLLFLILIWRLLVIASNASSAFGALLVVGVISHFAIQVILNIAVVTNTVPNTGISLPFISYGGSAVICQLAEMGMALSVERNSRSR